MEIHEYDAVFPFKGCLGRTCLDAGGIFAMVAGGQKRKMFEFFRQKFVFFVRESIMEMLFPNPFDFLFVVDRAGVGEFFRIHLVVEIRHIVGLVTRFYNMFNHFFVKFIGINDHAPAVGGEGLVVFAFHRCGSPMGIRCRKVHCRSSTQSDGSNTCYF